MKLSTKVRIFIILLLSAFSGLCVCLIPRCAVYLAEFAKDQGMLWPSAAIYAVLIGLAVPCVVILAIALRFVGLIERDEVFTLPTARTLSLIAYLFFGVCTVALGITVTAFCLGERWLTLLFTLLILIGFAIGVLLNTLAGYIRRAAALKEEVDSTL